MGGHTLGGGGLKPLGRQVLSLSPVLSYRKLPNAFPPKAEARNSACPGLVWNAAFGAHVLCKDADNSECNS